MRKLEVLNFGFNEIFWTFTTSERLWANFEPFLCQKSRIYTMVANSHRKSIVNLANGQKNLVKSSWWILIDYMYCVLAIRKMQKTVMNDVWKCLSLVPLNQFLRKKGLKTNFQWLIWNSTLCFIFKDAFYLRTTWEKRLRWN